ncbi:phytanoyl-CoA dioxygenase family protein [Halioxenophilus sp. WMMB6]|uniref:phytanoyl-CoA dioxygenase family protein n=1 Tax=Halioxenophilus sp. WMMB6 TaxID=3073815 RepID=UPI00295EB218|nr:phytanoyl-CoA dioxygenase family protein [Halioxenophilus sp. WMMB6]
MFFFKNKKKKAVMGAVENTLWVDQPDAEKVLSERGYEQWLQEQLAFFLEHGYVILNQEVAPELCDAIVKDAHAVFERPDQFIVRKLGKYFNARGLEGQLTTGDRIIDLYGCSANARSAVYTPRVAQFLQAVFQEPALAMQELYFEYGSQQAMHQDTAYVISQSPLSLLATWIALDDIEPGSGELMYYPGSHRFEPFLFNGETRGWNKQVHGDEQHGRFLQQLHDQAAVKGITKKTFHAKKGDVLIWHADLAHGGERRVNSSTRRSLVTHFAPQSIRPKYSEVVGKAYFEYPHPSGHYFTSRHYQLRDLANQEVAGVYYNPAL